MKFANVCALSYPIADCGVFCAQFAEAYSRRGQLNFCQADMLHCREKMAWELYDLSIPITSEAGDHFHP